MPARRMAGWLFPFGESASDAAVSSGLFGVSVSMAEAVFTKFELDPISKVLSLIVRRKPKLQAKARANTIIAGIKMIFFSALEISLWWHFFKAIAPMARGMSSAIAQAIAVHKIYPLSSVCTRSQVAFRHWKSINTNRMTASVPRSLLSQKLPGLLKCFMRCVLLQYFSVLKGDVFFIIVLLSLAASFQWFFAGFGVFVFFPQYRINPAEGALGGNGLVPIDHR